MVETSYEKCDDYIALAKKGLLENAAGCDQETTLEQKISGELSGVRGAVGATCMRELSRHNAPLIMATCGSKGNWSRTFGGSLADGNQDRLSMLPKW